MSSEELLHISCSDRESRHPTVRHMQPVTDFCSRVHCGSGILCIYTHTHMHACTQERVRGRRRWAGLVYECAADDDDDDDVQLSGTSHTQTHKHRGHQKNSNHQGVGGRGGAVGPYGPEPRWERQALMHLGVICSRGAAAAARVAGEKGARGATRPRQER